MWFLFKRLRNEIRKITLAVVEPYLTVVSENDSKILFMVFVQHEGLKLGIHFAFSRRNGNKAIH